MPLPTSAYRENIVVIGSFAGGAQAVANFFESVPADSGRCFFVIQQFSSNDGSALLELLPAYSCMPVLEIVDGGLLVPNTIFICPAGFLPIADGARVRLQLLESVEQRPLDAYLESLANTLGRLAAVVILSGRGVDGTLGAKLIDEAGGAVFVQTPVDCEFADLPERVLASGVPCSLATAQRLWQQVQCRKPVNSKLPCDHGMNEDLLQLDQESSSTIIADLKALQRRFDFALESAGMSWWDWDLEIDCFNVRNGQTCILGDSFCALNQGRAGWMELVHEDDREMVEVTLEAHLRGDSEEWVCEHRFRKMDNEWVWVSNRGMVTQRDESGNALYMMGNTVVIDRYKKALVEATYQRDILAAAGKIAGLGSWEYSIETNRVIWSDQIREILEVDADFDPNLQDSFEFFPALDRARLEKAFELLIADGTPYDLDLRCVSQRGRRIYTLAAGRAQYDPHGKIVGAVGVFQDVTKAELREHEMQAFFALSPDFQATINFDGEFQSCSPSWLTELGYPDGFLAHMSVADIVTPDHRIDFLRCFSSVVKGAAISNYETRVFNYSDYLDDREPVSQLWLSWSFSSDPDLKLIFVSARCVTEQHQINQRLIDERIRAEQANNAKSDFLAVMSHELRTPLNPIMGFSELLLCDIENPEHQNILKMIVESGQHLIQLIDEVLDYSKLEAHKTEVELSDFSLEEFILEKVRLTRGQLTDKDVVLTHTIAFGPFEGGVLPTFVGDVSILTQIVRNLLSNALKFTSVGEVSLTVEVKSAEAEVAMVCFSVSDSGIGIAPEDHERIFEAFTQADTSNTREFGGTGLGLAICRQFSDLLGGKITVESALGQGATFELYVPLRYLEGRAAREGISLEAQADGSSSPPEPSRGVIASDEMYRNQSEILIVEDNHTNQFYLDTLLKRHGCRSTIVADGESALALIAKDLGRFSWIFLDLHMPGMGGVAALEGIREMERQAAVAPSSIFVMTADAEVSVKQECLDKGANEFLVKPAPVEEVLCLLKRYSAVTS